MKLRWKFGVAVLSLVIVAAAIVLGVVFGTGRNSDDGQTLPVLFTISFETDGGTAASPITGEAGREIEFPACEKAGYEFAGWFTDEGFTRPAPVLAPAENITYFAKFEKLHTVRFVSDADEIVLTGKAGEPLEIPVPNKEKAEFDGWYLDEKYTLIAEPEATFSGDFTFYAKFSPLFTVRFLDGAREALPAVTGRAGKALELSVPQKPKSVFEGWFADDRLTEPAFPKEIPEADAVYYAKFSPLFTVSFYTAEGGLFSFTGRAGELFDLPDPAYEGMAFEGWFSGEDGRIPVDPPNAIPDCDRAYYAKYARLYTVTFETAGGTAIPSVTAKAGTPIRVISPRKEGYAFEGWTTEENGGDPVSVSCVPEFDVTYFAKYAKLYFVSFEAEGKEVARVTGKEGDPIAAPLYASAPAGYVFLGWQNESGELARFPVPIGTADTAFRAAFGEIPVLRFFANPPEGAEASGSMAAVEGIYGQEISVTLAENGFSVSGYRFAGWADSAQGEISYRNGDAVAFSKSVSLYARWARPFTCPALAGVRVFYCDTDDTALLEESGSAQRGSVSENGLGETQFEIGAYAGRLNRDGTFTPRGGEYGIYRAEGYCVFLSGYGTAALLADGREDRGVYTVEMGNLLRFESAGKSGTYRFEREDKTILYVDNTAVFGCYYNARFTAFVLGESASLGGERGVYVAGNGRISFYFGGVETQAEYFEDGAYFCYRDTFYYRLEGEVVFAGDGACLTFEPNGNYPADAVLQPEGGGELFGALTETEAGRFEFCAVNGENTLCYSLRLSYGARRAELKLLRREERTVWRYLSARAASAEGTGFLCITETYDYECGDRERLLKGELPVGDRLLALSDREIEPNADTFEYELFCDGVRYRVRVKLFRNGEARYFGCDWFGTRAAEPSSACGEYRISAVQFAGSAGMAEYEGVEYGAFLSFRIFAGEAPLAAEYAFSQNGAALFYVFEGDRAGQYSLRFSWNGGFLVGFSCEKREIMRLGVYVFALDPAGGFESLYDSAGEKRLLPLLDSALIGEGAEKLAFGVSCEDCLQFVYEPDTAALTRCETRAYETDGFAVRAVVAWSGERVFSVRVAEGTRDLGAAENRGGVWIAETEFWTAEVRFLEDCAEISVSRVKKIFTAASGDRKIETAFTLKGAEELDGIVSVTYGGVRLDSVDCAWLSAANGYYISGAAGERRHLILRISAVKGTVEEANLYLAEDGGATVSVLYGESWYAPLPALQIESPFAGAAVCRGEAVCVSQNVWELRAGQAGAIEIELTRRANLLAPFSVTVRNLPELVYAIAENGEAVAEAAVSFGENGALSVFSFRTQTESFLPKAEEIVSLGGGRWYFTCGYLLVSDDGFSYLEPCERTYSLTDGDYEVELAEAGIAVVPVRLLRGGEILSGTFTERSEGVWLWEGDEALTLVFSAEYDRVTVRKA